MLWVGVDILKWVNHVGQTIRSELIGLNVISLSNHLFAVSKQLDMYVSRLNIRYIGQQ